MYEYIDEDDDDLNLPEPQSSRVEPMNQQIEEKYTIGDEFAGGHFGAVFAGTEIATGDPVAIKETTLPQSSSTFKGEDVPLEVGLLKALVNVPGVIRFRDWYKTGSDLRIVMDRHLSACTLADFLEKNAAIEEREVAKWYKMIVEAVVGCHNAGVLHFDLKSDNFLIDEPNNSIFLIDFGCGAFIEGFQPHQGIRGFSLYFPPEYKQRKQYHPIKGTVWALGCLLVGMIERTPEARINPRKMAQDPKFRNGRSAESLDLIDRCLLADPNERASFDDILQHGWFNQN